MQSGKVAYKAALRAKFYMSYETNDAPDKAESRNTTKP